jgi:hypothetical protein
MRCNNGGAVLPLFQPVSQDFLKQFLIIFRTIFSVLKTCYFKLIFFLLISCTLYFIPLITYAAQVTLAWDTSVGSVTGYNMHYGTTSGNYGYSVDVGNFTSCTISGLQEGVTFYFAVTAYNEFGESDYSKEITHTIPFTIPSEHAKTTTVTSPNGGEKLSAGGNFEITWSSEGEIDFVKIEYSINNGVDWKEIIANTENDGSYDWNVPFDLSDECLIRISGIYSDVSDESHGVFSINGNPGNSCGAGKVLDCGLNCVNSATAQAYIGDGYCDDENSAYGYVLTCPAFNDDGSDCDGGNPGDSCGPGKVLDCGLNCVNSATAQAYIGDGYCDDENSAYGYVLACPAFNDDGSDCGS